MNIVGMSDAEGQGFWTFSALCQLTLPLNIRSHTHLCKNLKMAEKL